jgi:hypothetical protein
MYINDWGTREWYVNGKRHREDGPAAITADGSKYWCLNDKFHREDGPAIERADGSKEWHVNDKYYDSFDNWLKAVNISDEQKVFLKLKWG